MPMGVHYLQGNFSENCLILSVFRPRGLPSNAAVLVYIHGGGFQVGGGLALGYYPTGLAAVGDVIAVAINYRLGSLGFLSTNDNVIPGNFGVLDQQLALKWVKENIAAFGGDPDRVAIFGQSAGAASVGLHMLSPGSAGLFRGAVMQSGDASALWAVNNATLAGEIGYAFGKRVGCNKKESEELLVCLQDIEDPDIFIEQQLQPFDVQGVVNPFSPTVDRIFLPDYPNKLFAEGAINDAATIVGANADEGLIMLVGVFPENIDVAPFINHTFYSALQPMCTLPLTSDPSILETARLMYRDPSCLHADDCDFIEEFSQSCGDAMFVCPEETTAGVLAGVGGRVYRYEFTHTPTTSIYGIHWLNATHGEELSFVLGLALAPPTNFMYTTDEEQMAIQTIKYWSNLAKTGDPNLSSVGQQTVDWPVFTLEGLDYKDLSISMTNRRDIKVKECLFWNGAVPKLVAVADTAEQCMTAESSNSTVGVSIRGLLASIAITLAVTFYHQ